MPVRSRRFAFTLGILTVLGAPLPARSAQPSLAELHENWKKLKVQALEAEAEAALLQAEKDILHNGPAPQAVPDPPEAVRATLDRLTETLRTGLKDTEEKRHKTLNTLLEDTEKDCKAVQADWEKAVDGRVALLERSARSGPAAPLWDARLRLLSAWGGIVVLVGLLLAYRTLRVRVRREWRGGRRVSALRAVFRRSWLSLLAAVVMLAALGASAISDSAPRAAPEEERGTAKLEKESADLEAKCKVLNAGLKKREKDNASDRKQVESERNAVLNRWSQWASRDGQGGPAAVVIASEKEAYDTLHKAEKLAALAQKLADEAGPILAQLATDSAGLESRLAEERSRARLAAGLRGGLFLTFLVLAFVPLAAARRQVQRQLAAAARQCPRCLSGDQLKEKDAVRDPRYPDPRYLFCPECSYEFRHSYLKYPRLCFPTVGIRSGGKTHWLVTAYDRIKTSNVPVQVTLKQLPSLGDDRFDKLMQLVLEARQRPGATRHQDLPDPLNFHLTDRDRLGGSTALLNLFDFGGEMMDQHINVDLLRRRALLMDGFVLFLDPTQVRGGGSDASIRDQINQLGRFYEEMCDIRGLEVGQKIPMPVAVCISKLDLLKTKNPMAGQAIPWLRTLRETMGCPVDLALLHTRSRLCEEQLHLIFPGWDLPRTLRESFGNRFLFFPLTPVGLEESEMEANVVEDLERRAIRPFGVLEPILWLLHMHGYCVFD